MAMRPKLGAVDTCAGAPAKSPATTNDTTAKFVATPYFSGPDDLPRRPHQRADPLTPPRAATPKLRRGTSTARARARPVRIVK
jgi:hypothetical protein